MKQKTKKAAIKRLRLTKNGKLVRRVSFGRHLRKNKSASQKRRFRKTVLVKNKKVIKKMKRLMAKA